MCPAPVPRKAAAAVRHGQEGAVLDPSALDVRLERLGQERGGPEQSGRDPFRFGPAAPPPPPSAPSAGHVGDLDARGERRAETLDSPLRRHLRHPSR